MLRNCVYNTSLHSAAASSANTVHNYEFKHYHPLKLFSQKNNKRNWQCKERAKPLSLSAFIKRPLKSQFVFPKVEVNNSNNNNCRRRKCALMLSSQSVKNYKLKNVNDVANSHISFMKQTKQAIISRNNIELNELNIHTLHNGNSTNAGAKSNDKDKLLKGNNAEIFLFNYFNKRYTSSREVKDIITNEICNKSHNRSAFINRFLRKERPTRHSKPKQSSSIHIERNPWLDMNRKINVLSLVNDSTCMCALLNSVCKDINISISNNSFI